MQRYTIIPSDRLVAVDGLAKSPLAFEIDPAIHAVQWYGSFGEIEFVPVFNGETIEKPANQFFTDANLFQPALDAWSAYVSPPTPGEAPGPV